MLKKADRKTNFKSTGPKAHLLEDHDQNYHLKLGLEDFITGMGK